MSGGHRCLICCAAGAKSMPSDFHVWWETSCAADIMPSAFVSKVAHHSLHRCAGAYWFLAENLVISAKPLRASLRWLGAYNLSL